MAAERDIHQRILKVANAPTPAPAVAPAGEELFDDVLF